jgi:hypothetical protein
LRGGLLLLQWGILRGRSGLVVGEVYDGGRGRRAGGLGGRARHSAGRGLRGARGAPGEAGEVGGGEERRLEDVARGGVPGGLAGDEGDAIEQAPEIPGRHGNGRRGERGRLVHQEGKNCTEVGVRPVRDRRHRFGEATTMGSSLETELGLARERTVFPSPDGKSQARQVAPRS